ncbi:hypothetical protein HN51_043477 [Arachis hypogaea]|uniref:uncharacterized protein n=1 Tax=Arachis hypogaea TaxID=3818 RepID=UPI0007AF3DB5|nr:uncharacterized protein LOC107610468 isoform X1 [Arachis ipaensis]XP_025669517.1 uncharacterized protein LOC112769268 isoform X1 [Arachis hypogaea]
MAQNKGLHGENKRKRQYGFMVMLAFGVSFLGVLMLHKFRERRVCSFLVKEKDGELLSLQLLLQKERDHNKEIEGKIEEMKAKIYSLKGQKMELDKRVLQMKSTMDSLKEEQRVIESAFEEKQNEIRMLQVQGKILKNNSELNTFKDGEIRVESKDEVMNGSGNDDRLIETNEHDKGKVNRQVKDTRDDSNLGVTAKSKSGKENEINKQEEQQGVEKKANGKDSVMKHAQASRLMWRQRRKNSLNAEAREHRVDEIRQ